MATIKSYTDLEQSKKLAEILSPESADYCWGIDDETLRYNSSPYPCAWKDYTCKEYYIPCWSLAALVNVLPSRLFDSTPKRKELYLLPDLDKSYCFYRQFAVKTKGKIYLLTEGECLVDACYEMILKLHEQNLL